MYIWIFIIINIISIFAVIVIYRNRNILLRRKSTIPPEFSGIVIRCRKSNAEIPIEKIMFKCSGSDLGNNKACENFLYPITFKEMVQGYRNINKHDADTIKNRQILNAPLNIPTTIKKDDKQRILKALLGAKCILSGHPIVPYCQCQGVEQAHPILFDFDLADIICLTGPRSSGKTIYFHMLERYFNDYYIVNYNINVEVGPYATRRTIRDNYEEMKQTKFLPAPTEKVGFEVRFTIETSRNGWPPKPIKLFFYDTAGEITEKMESIEKHFGFFAFSSNLIIFVDPYNIPELARAISYYGPDSVHGKEGEFIIQNLLDDLIEYLEKRRFPGMARYPMNLAVAITKCDEFMKKFSPELNEELGKVHQLGALRPNLEPLDKISDLFKQWLLDNYNKNYIISSFVNKAESKFRNVGFFPISSLGTGVKRTLYKTEKFVSGASVMSQGQSIDEMDNKPAGAMIAQSSDTVVQESKVYRWQYDPQLLEPKYLDHPILWLIKHRLEQ